MRVAVRWSLAVLGLAMAEVAQAQIAPAPLPSGVANDPGQSRIVAYIYETIPITREELGEYLIARFGTERLDLLVNKRIIEIECRDVRQMGTGYVLRKLYETSLPPNGTRSTRFRPNQLSAIARGGRSRCTG